MLRCALAALAIFAMGRSAAGAPVPLASLGGASVQTLIDLGGDGVTAGGEQYYNFSYFASATADGAAPAASAVRVQAATTGSADDGGLRFVASWIAADGAEVSGTISFDVAPIDPTQGIEEVGLMSNGTAPEPSAGTFVTTTLLADTFNGVSAAPILSTFDDGRSTATYTAAPDTDDATAMTSALEPALFVTDTLTAASSAGGGVASASVVQDLFQTAPVAVPEPTGAVAVVAGAVLLCLRRRVLVG
jgi:hypothetical protein